MSMMRIIAVAMVIVVVAVIGLALWRRRRPLKTDRFQDKWKELQQLCRNKEDWPKALAAADSLLDEALRKKRLSGKTMGERMVKAQRLFTDNDGVWFSHKLRNKVDADPELKLKEDDVKSALVAIRQALKDLGALPK
jgi:hypothetical protein